MHTIERYHDISCGHRVAGHESKCAHLHGHNYRVIFECCAQHPMVEVTTMEDAEPRFVSIDNTELDSVGRVIDFSVVKEKLCMWLEDNWDHKFLAWDNDTEMMLLSDECPTPTFKDSFVWVPFNPTAENIARHLVEVVGPRELAGTGVMLRRCKVEETRKCSATYALPGVRDHA